MASEARAVTPLTCPLCFTGPLQPCDKSTDEYVCDACQRHVLIDPVTGAVLLHTSPTPVLDVNGVQMFDP